jgi:predicted GNAT family acetyltransferase
MSEIERFRKIDLAEEQKRERETLRAKRDQRDHSRRQRNLEREKLNKEKERLAQETEENRLQFKRTYVGNRPNKSGCGWDPVNMKLNEARVRKEDLKEEERMRMKREMVEKRTHSESFDIVTHLEKRGMSSCAAFAKEKTTTTREVSPVKTGGAENFNDFVGI